MTSVLSLNSIVKEYPNGVRAVDGVSLDVAEGEVIAVVGPSGCGKSTLLRCLNGLEELTLGELLLDGVPVSRT